MASMFSRSSLSLNLGPQKSVFSITRRDLNLNLQQVRNKSSTGRVRNALKEARKVDARKRLANEEARLRHSQMIADQRAKKIERVAERARKHAQLLAEHHKKKAERLAASGPSAQDQLKLEAKARAEAERAKKREEAQLIIKQATSELRELIEQRKALLHQQRLQKAHLVPGSTSTAPQTKNAKPTKKATKSL